MEYSFLEDSADLGLSSPAEIPPAAASRCGAAEPEPRPLTPFEVWWDMVLLVLR